MSAENNQIQLKLGAHEIFSRKLQVSNQPEGVYHKAVCVMFFAPMRIS